MKIKNLEKQLKKLRKTAEKERKEAELKSKIRELKYRKLIAVREKVRRGTGRLGIGAKKMWEKMKEMEKENLVKQKRRKPQEDFSTRLNKALSGI